MDVSIHDATEIIMREELIIYDALVMFRSLSFMRASLNSSCLAKRHKRKALVGRQPNTFTYCFVCSHDYDTVVIIFYCFCFNKVPSKALGIMLGDT